MGVLSVLLISSGLTILVHAIYSAYEHSLLPVSSKTGKPAPLPTDIVVETLLVTVLLIATIVFSAPPLRPIRWNEWAGAIEREGTGKVGDSNLPNSGLKGADAVLGNPYRTLEDRKNFWDPRGARRRFADYVREGAHVQTTTSN